MDDGEFLWRTVRQCIEEHVEEHPDAEKGFEEIFDDYRRSIPEVRRLIDWIFFRLCNQSLGTMIELMEEGTSDLPPETGTANPGDVESLTFKSAPSI